MTPNTTSGFLDRHAKIIAAVSAVVIFIIAAFTALWFSLVTETRAYEKETLRTTQQINEKVTRAIGTLHSMSATHQASVSGYEHSRFAMFADTVVSNQPAITATGRYEILQHYELEKFTSELQQHGLLTFKPLTISGSENLVPLQVKEQYSSLISFFPEDPIKAKFIGLDLSELVETQSAIQRSVRSASPVAITLPSMWFAEGQINVFTPSYFGRYVPENIEERLRQTDGGYFITLNLIEIVNQSTEAEFALGVGIALQSKNYEAQVVSQAPRLEQERLLPGLFGSQKINHSLSIGNGSAAIRYTLPAGATSTQLISATGYGLAALFIFSILATILLIQRTSRSKIQAKEAALVRERERALVTLTSLQDSVITTDSEDKIDYLNPAALTALKTKKSELIGVSIHEVMTTYFDEASDNPDKETESSTNNNTTKKLKDSEETVFNCKTSAITNNNNKIGAVWTLRDISKEHALTTDLAYLATHDALTGLSNRRKFEAIVNGLLNNKEQRADGYHSVSYIDLDQFKLVNDTAGHVAGDELLKKLAKDLVAFAPEHVEIARLGGDEFGVVCSHPTLEYTVNIAKKFHDFFQSYYYQTEENMFTIRASIGLTTIKAHHNTINDVLSEVDIACYSAKDAGRNSLNIYDAENQDTKNREGEMLYFPILQSAIKNDQFELYIQPIVATTTKNTFNCHHYECLLRLIGTNGEVITPYKFIVAAERYDLIRDIDKWVIKNALQQIAELKNTHLKDTIFSINLSGQSAVDSTLPEYIDSMLNKYKVNTSNVCFELTETAVISNFNQAQKLIAFLREKGCTIALDDFGAGASSFGYLKNLQVDYLKIDGQFVKEMTSNKVDFEMVRAMTNVGQALGIKTIAEFVENADIMHALNDINVDYAQGYHIGKPTPMSSLLHKDLHKAA